MFSDWMPEADFVQKSALWGKPVGTGYTSAELAEFIDYWKAEGKVFHQAQWEQKLAVSISVIRSRTSKSTKGGHHEQAAPAATSSGKSRARQKIEAAYEAKFGRPYMEPVGDDGGDLLGSVGGEERSGTVITLGAGDWQSQ